MIREEAWPFYRTISGVRPCWELEKSEGPKGSLHLLAPFLAWARSVHSPASSCSPLFEVITAVRNKLSPCSAQGTSVLGMILCTRAIGPPPEPHAKGFIGSCVPQPPPHM